jgi:hypothetical protein
MPFRISHLRRDGPAVHPVLALLHSQASTNDSNPPPRRSEALLVYPADRPTDGMMAPLAKELMPIFEYDALRLDERKRGHGHRIALQLRQAGKRIFRVRMIRKGGRLLVELSGADPGRALAGIRVCRDHFDQWFGITNTDVERFEEASS